MSDKKTIFKPILFITSFMCLIPIIIGFILWDKLPESIPQQYGWNDQSNWELPKLWAIITLPIFMCILNFIMHISINYSKVDYSPKVRNLICWLIPIIELPIGIFMLLKPIGLNIETFQFVAIILSIVFILLGNYLPKTEPNHFVGIRATWTMNPEVWRKTHRVSGFAMVLMGFFNLIICFTPIGKIAFIASVAFTVIFILVYSIIVAIKVGKTKSAKREI